MKLEGSIRATATMVKNHRILKHFFGNPDFSRRLLKKEECHGIVYNVFNRYQSQWSRAEDNDVLPKNPTKFSNRKNNGEADVISKHGGFDDFLPNLKWKPEVTWLSKALEPALQLWRRYLPTGNRIGDKPPLIDTSFSEIRALIQQSKSGLQDWSFIDLTVGMYLIYVQQSSRCPADDVKGEQIFSESTVSDLIYHTELALGAYKDNTRILAEISMLRESNVVKFVKDSLLLRPGYYIAVDNRKKLIILGIRGTQTLYDLITDIVHSSHEEITFEGYSTHYGTAEAARWFLQNEMETIRKCLEKHEGYRLRLVGHSLGGATASLLAIMLRRMSIKELGFDPEIVSAIGCATPPCVSKDLAESCCDYVATVVMQDDIIPRLSVASMERLRNEILQMDWASVLEKEDWNRAASLFTNVKQLATIVQDGARKLADYANISGQSRISGTDVPPRSSAVPSTSIPDTEASTPVKKEETTTSIRGEELFVPGSLYYLKRNVVGGDEELFTLLKRHPGEHFYRILLSSNLLTDHKCESHIYALRDVLKGVPTSSQDSIFSSDE